MTASVPLGAQFADWPGDPPGARAFEAEASSVLQQLRTSLAEVVANLPGPITKPAELQRALRIDMKLSCKVFKMLSATGSLAAGPHVPGLSAIRTFLNAAVKAGVRELLVSTATQAAEAFNEFVTSHAGDRTAFDSMISSFAGTEDAAQITLQHRRAAFRSQRHIFGVEAKLQLHCLVIQPAAKPGMLDLAKLTGFFSLRQLRPGAPLIVSEACATNDDGSLRTVHREPLSPHSESSEGPSLLPEFCSQPLPQFRKARTARNTIRSILVGSGVGKKAASTCVEGHVVRGAVPRYRDSENRTGAMIGGVRMPCEMLYLDLLVHKDTFGAISPTASTFAEHWGEVRGIADCDEGLRLQPTESVAYLGRGPSVLYATEIPRYVELGQYIFDRLGWDRERFDVYRCRVEYPVLPSTVVMQFELPPSPTT